MPNNRVEILYSVALYIFNQARALTRGGIGQDIYGEDLGFPGEIDNIPDDTETYRWAQAAAMFARYVANILAYVLEAERENAAPRIEGEESGLLGTIFEDITNEENG